jgi:transposase InsO family protein
MRRGFLYLVAIMDWATRKVLAWRLSNTMDAGFCVAALDPSFTVDWNMRRTLGRKAAEMRVSCRGAV